MKKISFVIPCYRSENTLPKVIAEIDGKMGQMQGYDYDIFLINDCSPDGTFDVIKSLCEERFDIKGINFTKNFGQHAALMAGFHYVNGDIIVCMDDDGQTPANEVGKLLDANSRTHQVLPVWRMPRMTSGLRSGFDAHSSKTVVKSRFIVESPSETASILSYPCKIATHFSSLPCIFGNHR